jgi:hypothetical protein
MPAVAVDPVGITDVSDDVWTGHVITPLHHPLSIASLSSRPVPPFDDMAQGV